MREMESFLEIFTYLSLKSAGAMYSDWCESLKGTRKASRPRLRSSERIRARFSVESTLNWEEITSTQGHQQLQRTVLCAFSCVQMFYFLALIKVLCGYSASGPFHLSKA